MNTLSFSDYCHLFTMEHHVTFVNPKRERRRVHIPTKLATILVPSSELTQTRLRGYLPSTRMHGPKKPNK